MLSNTISDVTVSHADYLNLKMATVSDNVLNSFMISQVRA